VLITGDSIHCKPGVLNFFSNLTSVDPVAAYQWNVDKLPVGNLPQLSSLINPGNHLISLEVTTTNGCTDSVTRSIIVDSVNAAFTISRNQFCGDTGRVQFTQVASGRFAIAGYEWFFGDGTWSNLPSPAHTYQQPGIYDVMLVVTSIHGCRDTLLQKAAIEIYRNPVASFTGNALHCSPVTAIYSSNSITADSIATYQWRVNGGPAGNNAILNYPFAPAGNFDVSLQVTTSKGCISDTLRRIVIDSVGAAFQINNPAICGDSGTVRFTNLSASRFGNNTYEWDFGDGQTSAASEPAHLYRLPGKYLVTLKAVTANGCSAMAMATDTVVIYPQPLVTMVGEFEKCMQNRLVFSNTIVSTDVVTAYQWRVNGVAAGTADTLAYNFLTAGTFTISFNLVTRYGCDVTTTRQVLIHPLPVPNAGPDTTICLGSSVRLRTTDGIQYQWEPATGLQLTNTSSPLVTPLQTTSYRVTVTNQFGCIQKDTATIRVDVPVNLLVSSNDTLCAGNRVQLRAIASAASYLWSPAVGLTNATSASPFASPIVTTRYQVIAFSGNVCKNDTGVVTIVVGNTPVVNAGVDQQVASGTTIQLFAQVNSNDLRQYLWAPATGLSCVDCPNPQLIADNDITYRVTVQTLYKCTAFDEVRIVVFCGKGQLYIPKAFTPNRDGLNDRFYIRGYGLARVKRMVIFDRWGKKVFEKQQVPVNDPSQGWDGTVNGLAVGNTSAFVYIVDVICKDGQEFNIKGTIMVVK